MGALTLYRDDGPVARSLAPATSRLIPATGGALLAPLVLVGALLLDGRTTGLVTAGGWGAHLVLASAAAGGAVSGRARWLVPAALRAAEYTFVAWLAWRSGGWALPLGYALLLAVASHHYDVVYRVSFQRAPAGWVALVGGGWDGRTAVLLVASFLGVVPAALAVTAAWCAVLFVGESTASWRSAAPATPRVEGS